MFVVWNLLPYRSDPASLSCMGRDQPHGVQIVSVQVAPSEPLWAWRIAGFLCFLKLLPRQFSVKKFCHELGLALTAAFHIWNLLGYIRVPHPTDCAAKHRKFFPHWGISSSVCPFFFFLLFPLVLRLSRAVQIRLWVTCSQPCMRRLGPALGVLEQKWWLLRIISAFWKRTRCQWHLAKHQ